VGVDAGGRHDVAASVHIAAQDPHDHHIACRQGSTGTSSAHCQRCSVVIKKVRERKSP
jgi:hypothetical protein